MKKGDVLWLLQVLLKKIRVNNPKAIEAFVEAMDSLA